MYSQELIDRIDKLLDPQLGLCRGILSNKDKPHDRDEDILPSTAGELREARSVLKLCRERIVK